MVYVELISPYNKYIRQHPLGVTTMNSDDSISCKMMIEPTMGWFEIIEVTTFDLNEVTDGNTEYIDKSSTWESKLFNNTWICIYMHLHKVFLTTDLSLNYTSILC